GIILGMSRKEVDEKFREIVDFAEIWDFIDQPVKHYSSGMYLRLAFAVAAHTNPEILLIDEILAVGDASFQEKCFKKMDEFKQKQVTIIYVGHDLDTISSFCQRACFINHSQQFFTGSSVEAVAKYRASVI
ncbi:MAG: ATP-binding cassette domain-containing protein, partial [Patescibacteria group bacterium]